jgi:predicted RND superfamily exporter protein
MTGEGQGIEEDERRGLGGRLLSTVDTWIADRPERVVVAFLLLTVGFAAGLGNVSTETGTEQFTVGVPEEEALEAVNREFERPFGDDTSTTQLIQAEVNVLSKQSLLRMLELQYRLAERPDLRVESSVSAASQVALVLDPTATTPEAQLEAVERATPVRIEAAIQELVDEPGFRFLLSEDFDRRTPTASATIAVVEHSLPVNFDEGSGQQGGEDPLTPIQRQMVPLAASVGGDIRVFGSGIVADEFGRVVTDSLLVVVPAAALLIIGFLIVAYRDLVDLLLGVVCLLTTIVWTFGFMGLAGIPFGQFLIAVPPLLLAVGIDFGIHAVNRYREERAEGYDVSDAMTRTTHQLLVAFAIVTGTTVVGFLSNLSSSLVPIRDFGVVASVGIVFTFLIFGVFLPALKVSVDRLRERYPIPTFSTTPLGGEGSVLGRVLAVGLVVARRAPVVFLAVVLVGTVVAGSAVTDLDTSFSEEDFLPPEETSAWLRSLPEPFRPGEYTITASINFLEDAFETGEDDTVTVYVEGPMRRDDALESIARAGEDPPDTFVRQGRVADAESILTVVEATAARDPAFAALVDARDTDGNGVPDEDLATVYESLFDSSSGDVAREYLQEDYRGARVVYTVEADADPADVTADTRLVADRHRFAATATGSIVVFQAIAAIILRSAVVSLALALAGTAVFLTVAYWVVEGRPSLGVVNLVPVVVTVAALAWTMRELGIAFNAFTATVLAVTIGLGIDYSVHVVHRYVDERHTHDGDVALDRAVKGTGGALAGSVVTTAAGIGVLMLAVFPAIGQFGLLTAISVVYSFLASILVLPSTLAVWDRLVGPPPGEPTRGGNDAPAGERTGATTTD